MVTPKQGLIGVRCNHTTTNPLRVSSVAKGKGMASISTQGVEKGKGMHEAINIMVMLPKWLHLNKAT